MVFEWTSEYIPYRLRKQTIIKWYVDEYKTQEETRAGVFGPKTKYSESIGKYFSIC